MNRWVNKQGFTIVELLIVVVVIAILAAITIVAYNGISNRAKDSAVQSAASQASKKVLAYAAVNSDGYPAVLDDAGITNDTDTTYDYRFITTANVRAHCISATKHQTAWAVTNKSSGTVAGRCAANLVLNPSFELNTSGWAAAGTAGTTLTRVTTEFNSGTASLQAVSNGVAANQGVYTTARATVLPNLTYTASIWVKGESGKTMRLELGEMDATNTLIGARTNSATITANGSWQRLTATRTMGATAASADIVLRNSTAVAHTFYVDGAMIDEGSSASVYNDGNNSAWTWAGTQNASASIGPTPLQ